MFFPMPKSMYWQTPIWPQFHVKQFALHLAGITEGRYESLPMAIATMIGFTVVFAGVTIWSLKQKG
jgi:ABC-2 type transport system permease protein